MVGNRKEPLLPPDDRRVRLNQRLRQEFIDGAEEESRRRLGRGLTAEEWEWVLRHYPGDPQNSGRRSSFARLGRWRRLSRCYERTEASATAWLEVAGVGYLFARRRSEPT
jgi:hypothetical protein